jgi:rod shape-determining protein MreD
MRGRFFIQIIRFALFVAAQVLVFNHINLGGFVNPYVYIIFVLMLPLDIPGWLALLSSFMMGLSVDIFTHTPGLHASAATLTVFLRPYIIRLIDTNKEIEPGLRPTLFDMGARWYFFYSVSMILIHHIYLYFLERMSFAHFIDTFTQALLSAATTIMLAYLSQYLFYFRRK